MGDVFLTGSRGWIGGLLLGRLQGHGLSVSCLNHASPAAEVAEAARVAKVVVHAGGAYTNKREQIIEGNVEQTLAVAKGCSKSENTVLYLSSVKMYGWDVHGGLTRAEDDLVTTAADPYTKAKLLSEQLLSDTARRAMILRVANVYGVRMPAKYIIGGMLRSFAEAGKVTVACTGASLRDFVDIGDVVTVIENMVLSELKSPGPAGRHVYNLASGQPISFGRVAGLFKEELGAAVEVKGGNVLSSPRFGNEKSIHAGYIRAFREPAEGLRDLLGAYRREPWEGT